MFFRKLIPALVWAFLILVVCGFPGNKLPEITFWKWLKPDKITHLLLFAVQSYLLLKAFRSDESPIWISSHAIFLAIAISISYGALTEVLQEYVFIKRTGDVRDAIANALGAFAGWYLFRRKNKIH